MSDGTWRLLKFHRAVPEAHQRMRELIRRVYAFIDKLDSGADGNQMVQLLLAHFATDKPLLFGIGVIHDDTLVGHILMQLENYYGCTNMTVLQYELDESPPLAFHRESFGELLDIGQIVGARNLVAVCPDERVERLHRIFHGMKRYATLMTLDLRTVQQNELEEAANG
jgi:hypothetical protein